MANRDWIPSVGDTVKIRHEDRAEVVTKVKPIHHWGHEEYDPFPIVTNGGFMWRLIELEPIPPTPVAPAGGSIALQATTTEERESVRTLQAAQAPVREEAIGEPVDAGTTGEDLGAGADDGITPAYWEGLMRALERAPMLADDVEIDVEPIL